MYQAARRQFKSIIRYRYQTIHRSFAELFSLNSAGYYDLIERQWYQSTSRGLKSHKSSKVGLIHTASCSFWIRFFHFLIISLVNQPHVRWNPLWSCHSAEKLVWFPWPNMTRNPRYAQWGSTQRTRIDRISHLMSNLPVDVAVNSDTSWSKIYKSWSKISSSDCGHLRIHLSCDNCDGHV